MYVACVADRAYSQSGKPLEIELGQQFSERFSDQHMTHDRFYLIAKSDLELASSDQTGATLNFNSAGRIWRDIDGPQPEIDLRAASLIFAQGHFRIELGFQEIVWGETFGLYIADLVNPRDYRDPLFNEMSWLRLPVFALNTQVFLDRLTLQFVVTPVPRNNELPEAGSAFDPTQALTGNVQVVQPKSFDVSNFGQDAELGGKASYLTEFGLDIGLFYFLHWNRNLVYELRQSGSQTYLVPVVSQVDSFGMTASQALGLVVVRADSVLHLNQPIQNDQLGPATYSYEWQTILGADLTTDGEWTFGAQFHSDNTSVDVLQWMSGKISKKLLNDQIEAELFIFGGLNNMDSWIQPKLTWNATSQLSLSARADFLNGSRYLTDGILSGVRDQSRVFTWVSYRF